MKSLDFYKAINDELETKSSSFKILNIKYSQKNSGQKNFSIGGISGVFSKLDPIISEDFYLLEPDEKAPEKKHYDFVVASFPMGVRDLETKDDLNIKLAIESLNFIGPKGFGLYEFQNQFYTSVDQKRDLNGRFKENGFYINAIISIPKNLTPFHGVKTSVFIISKEETSEVFIAELKGSQDISKLIHNYSSKKIFNYDDESGWIKKDAFFPGGFERIKFEIEKANLISDYQNYKEFKISEIKKEIIKGSKDKLFIEKDNSLYIPSIGVSNCVTRIEDLKNKQQNYFQVVINSEYATNKYLASYLNSPVGIVGRESIMTGSVIRFITQKNLENYTIPIPDPNTQDDISLIIDRFENIKKSIDDFGNSILLNPVTEVDVKKQIDQIAEILGALTAPEKIKLIIDEGESKTIEFKETFSLDVKTRTKESRLVDTAIKTVAAFLNSDGGDLLIGVSDNGEIKGLDEEIDMFDKSQDKFLLRFKNSLKHKIGESIYPLIEQRVVKVNNKLVFQITCKPSSDAVFVDGNMFYVRTNPATDRLEGPKMIEYINNRKKEISN